MKPGDLVKNKGLPNDGLGLFIGLRTIKRSCKYSKKFPDADDYVCAEVIWFNKTAPNGDRVSTIQTDLLEVVNESK